jgi:hypothetical protein
VFRTGVEKSVALFPLPLFPPYFPNRERARCRRSISASIACNICTVSNGVSFQQDIRRRWVAITKRLQLAVRTGEAECFK